MRMPAKNSAQWMLGRLVVLGMVAANVTACGSDADGDSVVSDKSKVGVERKTSHGTKSKAEPMPADLRAAMIASTQRDADSRYHAAREPSGAARFEHLSQSFAATVDTAKLRLAPLQGDDWELSMSMAGLGCEGYPSDQPHPRRRAEFGHAPSRR